MYVGVEEGGDESAVDVLGVEEALSVGVFFVDDCGCGEYFAFNVFDLSVFFEEHA